MRAVISSLATVLSGGTHFFSSKICVSFLVASVGCQQDCEYHDETKTTKLAGTNSSQNSGR